MATPNPKKFQLPEIKAKAITDSTAKVYMAHLNRLVKININTPELILSNQHTIVSLIKDTIPDNDEAAKQKKRLWMNAILYAVADKSDTEKSILKAYYPETFNYPEPGTEVTLKNGEKIIWKSREEYFATRRN